MILPFIKRPKKPAKEDELKALLRLNGKDEEYIKDLLNICKEHSKITIFPYSQYCEWCIASIKCDEMDKYKNQLKIGLWNK